MQRVHIGRSGDLEDVSFTTFNVVGADYVITVYLDSKDPADPTSGTLASTVGGSFSHKGLHTVNLGERVMLSQGQTFAVCIEMFGENLMVPVDTYELYTLDDSPEYLNDPIALEGQSFVDIGSGWDDISSGG